MAHPDPMELRPGVRVWHGYLDRDAQEALLADIRDVVAKAPLFRPVTARGRPMSVRMTSAGRIRMGVGPGRLSLRGAASRGRSMAARSRPRCSTSGTRFRGSDRAPQCCLVNFYDAAARMGLHQDRDEADFTMPVVSISLGDAALFRVGGTTRGGKTQSVWLNSGDVAVLSGEGRLAYHGIDRIRPGSSTLSAGADGST
jgi:alkylated DNA repair protein (DNA oxidative demethylase)